MPLKLKPPRPGRTPYWYIRGTHRGIYVERSTEETARPAAERKRQAAERECERRAAAPALDDPAPRKKTFGDLAVEYMSINGEVGGLFGIIDYFGDTPADAITQSDVNACAIALKPSASAATRNRHIYTPISAVLKFGGVGFRLKRPTGWRSPKSFHWLRPEQIPAYLDAADAIGAKYGDRFGLFVEFVMVTGARRGEAMRVRVSDIDLSRAMVTFPDPKNDDPRSAHLPPSMVASLANSGALESGGYEPVFPFTDITMRRRVRELKRDTGGAAGNNPIHVLRHTWATLMRQYGEVTTEDLVKMKAWRDPASAARYDHVDVTPAARRADQLPIRRENKS